MTVDWNALMAADPAAGAEMLRPVIEEMDTVLEADPEVAQQVLAALDRHLQGSLDTDSYTPVWDGIWVMFGIGQAAPRLYTWLSTTDQRARLEAVLPLCSVPLARLLRSGIGMYGQELSDAYRYWREYPDNWDALYRQVSFDTDRRQNRIDLRVVKYNHEEASLTLDSRSLLIFITRLVNSLGVTASDSFIPAELETFRKECDAFWSVVNPPEESAPEKSTEVETS